MKKSEHNSLPDDILQEFENGTHESRQKALRVWELLGDAEQETLNVPSTEEALSELEALIHTDEVETKRESDRPPVRLQSRMRLVRTVRAFAIAACVLIISSVVYFSIPVEHHTGAGERLSVVLSDGSEVELNTHSSLRYNRGFRTWYGARRSGRTVQLDGEAFFTVAKEGRPFKVETFNAEVTVLGTGFNVRAYRVDQEQETRITLDHGKVQVDMPDRSSQEAVILSEKGQQAVVSMAEIKQQNPDQAGDVYALAMAWRSQAFVALGLSVESLFNQIERFFDVEIEVSNELSLEPLDLIYLDSEPSVEDVLTDFCIYEECSFQKTASGYLLLSAK